LGCQLRIQAVIQEKLKKRWSVGDFTLEDG